MGKESVHTIVLRSAGTPLSILYSSRSKLTHHQFCFTCFHSSPYISKTFPTPLQ
jgi:hypothetical protein